MTKTLTLTLALLAAGTASAAQRPGRAAQDMLFVAPARVQSALIQDVCEFQDEMRVETRMRKTLKGKYAKAYDRILAKLEAEWDASEGTDSALARVTDTFCGG